MIGRLFLSIMLVGIVILGLWIGRQWYDSLLVRIDQQRVVHVDHSTVNSGVKNQVKPNVVLVYRNQAGERVRAVVDQEKYSAFVNAHLQSLEDSRQRIQEQAAKELPSRIKGVFDGIEERIERFADWYFAYPTTYKLLSEGVSSAARHTFSAEAISLEDAIAYDVEKYLHSQYENIVLKPEITHPQLEQAFLQTLTAAHNGYLNMLAVMAADFQAFIAQHTTHAEMPINTELELDWSSQFNKLNLSAYEKGPEGTALTGTLVVGGAVVGKAIGGAVGKGAVSKAVAGAASKGALSKLSAPFVSKAVLAGSGGAVGSVGGPLGTVAGIGVGLAVDYLINEGVELTQRTDFTADVKEAVAATQKEWETLFQREISKAIDIWFDDTLHLLPQYDAK